MIGAVGDDSFGVDLIDGLHRDNIDTTGVQTLSHISTGVSVIIVEAETGENRILFSPGANRFFKPDQLESLSSNHPNLIILQLELPLNIVLQALEAAKQNGIDVLLNPAPAMEMPDEAYPAITHLVLNEIEAATLSKIPGNDWERVARKFQDLGVRNVIITLGGEGVFYAAGDQTGHVRAESVEVVDTTAAGDTFVGAYAVSVVNRDPSGEYMGVEEAVRRANRAAALTVQKHGAQDAIPYLGEVPG